MHPALGATAPHCLIVAAIAAQMSPAGARPGQRRPERAARESLHVTARSDGDRLLGAAPQLRHVDLEFADPRARRRHARTRHAAERRGTGQRPRRLRQPAGLHGARDPVAAGMPRQVPRVPPRVFAVDQRAVIDDNCGVFTMSFGSGFGDWDSPDGFLRAALGSGWPLTEVRAGRPHWSFQNMDVGDPTQPAPGHPGRWPPRPSRAVPLRFRPDRRAAGRDVPSERRQRAIDPSVHREADSHGSGRVRSKVAARDLRARR
jgi:hypothetical protein